MKISVNNLDLTNALKELSLIKKDKKEELFNCALVTLWNKEIQLRSTDKEREISLKLVSSTGIYTGHGEKGILPMRELLAICKASEENEQIDLTFFDHTLEVRTKDMKSTIPFQYSVNDFPYLESSLVDGSPAYNEIIDIEPSILLEKLEKVSYSMAKNDLRYYLNGLCLHVNDNELKFVSTDGHRLSLDSINLDKSYPDRKIIIPENSVKALIKALKTNKIKYKQIHIVDHGIYFYSNHSEMLVKLIEGRFPDYTRVIPSQKLVDLAIDRKDMIKVLAKIEPFSNDKYKGVELVNDDDGLILKTNNPSRMETEIKLSCSLSKPENFKIGFNLVYLKEALNKLSNDIINLSLSGTTSSATIKESCNDSNFINIVLPMRL